MAFTVAYLIYSGVMPSLRRAAAALLCGFVLVRMDLFPPAASRGASIIAMNVALPALIFANIVPSFTPANVSALGPMFLVAAVYQLIGFALGMLLREIVYVPRNFWQGIVILTGMSNWGNLPNAIVMSVTQQVPFDPTTDPALGVSYVSIFTVCYHVVFWMCGASQSLAWDYLPAVPQGADAERRLSWKERPIGSLVARALRLAPPPPAPTTSELKDEETCSCTCPGEKGDTDDCDDGKDKCEDTLTTVCDPEPDSAGSKEPAPLPRASHAIPRIVVTGTDSPPTCTADLTEEADSPRQGLPDPHSISPRTAVPRLPGTATYRSRNLTLAIPPSPLRPSAAQSPVRGASNAAASVPPTPKTPRFATAPSSPAHGARLPSPRRPSRAPRPLDGALDALLAPTTPCASCTRYTRSKTPRRSTRSRCGPDLPLRLAAPSRHTFKGKARRCALGAGETLEPLLKPVTVALAVSLPVALITPLKRSSSTPPRGGPAWFGPDGRPPLAFVMDTAQFIDTLAVPITLILLGASFARLSFPRPLSRLPIAAMVLCALAKMALLPVIGVVMVQAMVRGGLIPVEARAERFVAMLLSGTPGAPDDRDVVVCADGNVDTIAAFLLVQYVFLFISNA
ncbi:membrane transport protein-domain-containing protein [Epithele typhae]|uniref:membrane transport protein-domain-containing protein n=1 Tax=Epithele typhae TaxID=378194 RepID=UPI0020075DEF|nr:membrane transport protein-domain-containing protein [Epithele typhae]KAH9920864.1 membrane transport protein-domain-containing protein [Epithele typhae]